MVAQGTTLAGRYRLDQRIGAGGMGEVWRGEDTVLARTVAVKVLLPGRLDDPGFGARFQGEARAMALINHPGVVDVYDYGVTDVPGDGPTAYLVMKFVDGEPLDRLLLRIGRIRPEAVMELIGQAAAAIQAVHDRGIVHRDVKPGNLLVQPDGTLVLTDFGIARSDAASRLTDAGMVLGTAAYCAPEQAEGEPVTPAVDIYALGVVAYECLAGHRPFDGDTPVTIALKHIREQPPPLPADIPPHIRHVVDRALSKSLGRPVAERHGDEPGGPPGRQPERLPDPAQPGPGHLGRLPEDRRLVRTPGDRRLRADRQLPRDGRLPDDRGHAGDGAGGIRRTPQAEQQQARADGRRGRGGRAGLGRHRLGRGEHDRRPRRRGETSPSRRAQTNAGGRGHKPCSEPDQDETRPGRRERRPPSSRR